MSDSGERLVRTFQVKKQTKNNEKLSSGKKQDFPLSHIGRNSSIKRDPPFFIAATKLKKLSSHGGVQVNFSGSGHKRVKDFSAY